MNKEAIINKEKNSPFAKPFLKWAGGKRQLLPVFDEYFPDQVKSGKILHYIEPFVGSGAVFFHLAKKYLFEKVILADINPAVILTYNILKTGPDELIGLLEKYEKKYLSLPQDKRKTYFYEQRSQFNDFSAERRVDQINKKNIERAALVIFLNKTCYNGLFRTNSKGKYNTPAGDYKNPRICDKPNLIAASNILQRAEIMLQDFRYLKNLTLKDPTFIYFDPPYRPLNKTSNFTSYSLESFKDQDQHDLAGVFKQLDKQGHYLMLSNSDPKNMDPEDEFFDALYGKFNIYRIPARRYINSNAKKRGNVNELLITNYTPKL
ncbi:MAG: DNA adenine methylase [Bacteroidota bacterium]